MKALTSKNHTAKSQMFIKESPSSNNVMLVRTQTENEEIETDEEEYKNVFRFGDDDLMIPFEKLDDT